MNPFRPLALAIPVLALLGACTAQPQPDGGWGVSDVGNPLAEPSWRQTTRQSANGPVCVLTSGHRGFNVELGGLGSSPPQYVRVDSVRYIPIGGVLMVTIGPERFLFREASQTGPEAWRLVNAMLHSPHPKMYLEWRERDGGRFGGGYQRSTNILPLDGFRQAFSRCRAR